MNEPNDEQKEKDRRQKKVDELKSIFTGDISYRREMNQKEFGRAQWLGWVSLVSSTITTIFTASSVVTDPIVKLVLAAIAAVPGFVVAIESGFNFAMRARMNSIIAFDVQRFSSRLDQGDDPFEVEKDYIAYMKKVEMEFPIGPVVPGIRGRRERAGVPGLVHPKRELP